MTRISTYGQLNSTLANVMRLQTELAEATTQSSSSLKSETYQGLGSDSQRVLDLEGQITRSQQYVQQGEIVLSRIETMYDAVTNMVDMLGNYQSLLSTAISGNMAEDAGLNNQTQSYLDTFTDLVNTRLSGRYLFAGDRTGTAPVDLSGYAAQSYPSAANTDYYQGDSTVASFKASDDKTITYGVTANQEAFEKAIRALSLGVNASEDPADEDAMAEALDLVNEALDGLLATQTKLSAAATDLDWEMDVQMEAQVRLEAFISEIKEVDVAEAVTRMETLQTQLEASYAAISRINEMNLFDYL